MTPQSFGRHMRQIRENRKISMKDLAKQIGSTVVNISDMERDKFFPSQPVAKIIASILNAPELLTSYARFFDRITLDFGREPEYVKSMMLLLIDKWPPNEKQCKGIIDALSKTNS